MKEEATVIFKEGKYEEAIEKFKKCTEIDPLHAAYNSAVLLNIAISQVKISKHKEAMNSLNLAIKFKPNYAKALVKRGEVNLLMEEYNDAIRDFSEASDHDSAGFGV